MFDHQGVFFAQKIDSSYTNITECNFFTYTYSGKKIMFTYQCKFYTCAYNGEIVVICSCNSFNTAVIFFFPCTTVGGVHNFTKYLL